MALPKIFQSSFKTEGTSKTYGQQVTTKQDVPISTKSQETKTSSNENITSPIVEDTSKSQTIFAAANSNNSSVTLAATDEVASVAKSDMLPKEQIIKVLAESQNIDLTIALKSKESDPLEFNSLQVPQQTAKFIYQRWSPEET